MTKFFSSKSTVFSHELEELISNSNVDLNKHILHKFLTIEYLPELTKRILEENEWDVSRLATASIFFENKSDDLLAYFLETIGYFICNDDEKLEKIEKTVLEGFFYALPSQIEQTINILNKLEEQFSMNDDFIFTLFYEKLKNKLSFFTRKDV